MEKLMQRMFLMLSALLLSLCPVGHAAARELTVSAAASLTGACTELKTAFEARHPGLELHMNYASSNALLRQMQEGAPADLFISADQETMDSAGKSGVIDERTRKNLVSNDLVLITPVDGREIHVLKDLTGLERIAIGNPESVPAGRYARESLTAAGLWDVLRTRFIFGSNVRQVLNYVARGEVDAGIVYATDALSQKDRVRTALVLRDHTPVLYPAAVATTGRNPDDARIFLDFALSEGGQAILQKHGFGKP